MSSDDKRDPVGAEDFQKVLRHFVTTPHKPHKPMKKREPTEADSRHLLEEKLDDHPSDRPKASR